jgi:cytochrome c-type biogenesis protein CcmH
MKMGFKPKLAITVLIFCLLFASPVRADSPAVGEISGELVCQCGCNMILDSCNHSECGSRDAITASIEQQIAQGLPKGQIIQSFVDIYGEAVLSSPPKRGFNLTAWILPFGALLIGGVVVYTALRVWVRQGKRPSEVEVEAGETNEEYRRRLEKELSEFTEE